MRGCVAPLTDAAQIVLMPLISLSRTSGVGRRATCAITPSRVAHYVATTNSLALVWVTPEWRFVRGRLLEPGVHWSSPCLGNCRGSFLTASVARIFRLLRADEAVFNAVIDGWRDQIRADLRSQGTSYRKHRGSICSPLAANVRPSAIQCEYRSAEILIRQFPAAGYSAIAHEVDIRRCVAHEIVHPASRAPLHPGMLDVSALPHGGHGALVHGCVTDLVEDHPESLCL